MAGAGTGGFEFEGAKNGSRNSRERKGWQNKDLKLKCDVKEKEEMSSLGPGDMGRSWAGGMWLAPLAQKLPEGWGGSGWAEEWALGSEVQIEVPGKTGAVASFLARGSL